MKSNYWLLTVIFALVALPGKAGEWIRINQLGYLPQSVKVAVFMSEEGTNVENYSLIDAFTGKVVRTFNTTKATGKMGGMKSTYRLNFSDFTEPGTYYLKAGKAVSPRFPINAQVYNGTADYLLHYMRQQRCGYNPFLEKPLYHYTAARRGSLSNSYHPERLEDNFYLSDAVWDTVAAWGLQDSPMHRAKASYCTIRDLMMGIKNLGCSPLSLSEQTAWLRSTLQKPRVRTAVRSTPLHAMQR